MTRAKKNPFRISDCGLRIERSTRGKSAMLSPRTPIRGRNPQSAIGGFTLAEVLVASTISGFVALIAVGALNAIAGSAQTVNRMTETTSEIRFAARMIARDLANLYRDVNPQNMKLVGSSQGSAKEGPPHLVFYTSGRAKARADQPEGDVYEVEYFLGTREQSPGQQKAKTAESSEEATVLFRRLWPNPDKDRTPGGVLTPIAENIGIFQVRFYDGKQWADEWTEEMQSLPELVEVTLATQPPSKGDPIVETMTVTFPRLGKAAAATQQGGAPEGQQGQPGSGTPSTTESPSGSAGQQGGSGGGGRP
ncbi:MAG: prepilin-type N-terminal cleavage/methylation domain-containing protein [Phycisphaerae bacterium]|nr:prepilin-type N-terminal cleavage/methylation domain-containing protein [Phycisphaerae bacterium]